MLKYTVIPKEFFQEPSAASTLSEVVSIGENDTVQYKELPQFKAVLVYAGEESRASEICEIVSDSCTLDKFNKVVVRLKKSSMDIVVVAGMKILLINTFPATDNVTREYFIFASVKQFQMNPALTTVYFKGDVPYEIKADLFKYFASVETI